MYSIFNKLNDSIINSSYPSKGKGLHITFFSKFKNLLDDYISNYFTKYLFYFLFIAFWVFEISYFISSNFDLIIHNAPSIRALYRTFFKVIAPYVAHEVPVISYLYSFFEFNLDFIRYIIYILTVENFFLIFLFVLFLMIGLFCIEYYTHLKQVSIFTLIYCYFFFSFLVFNTFKLELLSFEYASILMVLIPFLLSITTIKKVELLDLYIVGLMVFSSLIHPIFIILFLFSIIFLCRDLILELCKSYMELEMTESDFDHFLKEIAIDFALVTVFTWTIYPYINVTHEVFMVTLFTSLFFIMDYSYSFFTRKK